MIRQQTACESHWKAEGLVLCVVQNGGPCCEWGKEQCPSRERQTSAHHPHATAIASATSSRHARGLYLCHVKRKNDYVLHR